MMMKTTIYKFLVLFCALTIFSCNPQKQTAGYYSYETECLGVEQDGSQTVKGWGKGANKVDALEQAKKNAVRDVLFKGIRNGKSECNPRPVVGEVNAQQVHEDYFNKFFADGGPYLQFVSNKDAGSTSTIDRNRKGAGEEVAAGAIFRILRAELKQKMITDKIIITE